MNVAQLMNSKVITATAQTKLPRIWQLIFENHIHGLPVVDDKKHLIGIVSEEDILSRLYPDYREFVEDFHEGEEPEGVEEKLAKMKHLTASNVMCKRVFFTRPDTNVMRALSRMIIRKVRQLPVIDEEDRVVGVITKGDIFDSILLKKKGSRKKERRT